MGICAAMARKSAAVVAGVGRDAAELALLEEVVGVAQRREVAEVDARHRHRAAPVQRGERGDDDLTGRREHDRRVERFGWGLGGVAHPRRAQVGRQTAGVGRAGDDVHRGALGHGHLGRQVGRPAEAVDAESSPATAGRPAGGRGSR